MTHGFLIINRAFIHIGIYIKYQIYSYICRCGYVFELFFKQVFNIFSTARVEK
jgi:hypothetical protein